MGILSKLFGKTNARKFFQKGINSYKQGEYEKTIDALKQATFINPDFAEAWAILGEAYGFLGQFQESIDSSMEAIRLKPKFFEAYINLDGLVKTQNQRINNGAWVKQPENS